MEGEDKNEEEMAVVEEAAKGTDKVGHKVDYGSKCMIAGMIRLREGSRVMGNQP